MSVAALPAGLAKEFRALAPTWALCLAGVGTAIVAPGGFPEGAIAYVFGSLALGSQSIGHEFSSRTLPLLLSQPVDRRRLYRLKATALVPMMLTVCLAGVWILPDSTRQAGLDAILLLTPLCALLVTPWLTIVTRSALAGIVFTFGVPATGAWIASLLIGTPTAGAVTAALVICAVGAVAGRRRFTHLEASDAAPVALSLPAALRRAAARPRHPFWMLVLKELQLQQMTFAIAALYVVGWLIWYPVLRSQLGAVNPLEVLTPIYVMLLMVVMGSLTSAEERDLGTIDWQLLMPFAAWKQWAIKLAVVALLAALLVLGIPSLVAVIMSRPVPMVNSMVGGMALLLIASSIFISSLCPTAMRATVTSLVVLPAGVGLALPFLSAIGSATSAVLRTPVLRRSPFDPVGEPAMWVFFVGVPLLLLRFAYSNHRAVLPPRDHVVRQLLVVSAALISGAIAASFLVVTGD